MVESRHAMNEQSNPLSFLISLNDFLPGILHIQLVVIRPEEGGLRRNLLTQYWVKFNTTLGVKLQF